MNNEVKELDEKMSEMGVEHEAELLEKMKNIQEMGLAEFLKPIEAGSKTDLFMKAIGNKIVKDYINRKNIHAQHQALLLQFSAVSVQKYLKEDTWVFLLTDGKMGEDKKFHEVKEKKQTILIPRGLQMDLQQKISRWK